MLMPIGSRVIKKINSSQKWQCKNMLHFCCMIKFELFLYMNQSIGYCVFKNNFLAIDKSKYHITASLRTNLQCR